MGPGETGESPEEGIEDNAGEDMGSDFSESPEEAANVEPST